MAISESSQITRARRTSIILDGVHSELQEPAHSVCRVADEIKPVGSPGVHQLNRGQWQMRPQQFDIGAVSEQTDPNGAVFRLSAFSASSQISEHPTWRSPTDLHGATVGAGALMSAVGGHMLFRNVPAASGGSTPWDEPIFSAHVASTGQPELAAVPVTIGTDRLLVGLDRLPENRGFLVRFRVAGNGVEGRTAIHAFYFGGGVLSAGDGQACTIFSADGLAHLYLRLAVNVPDPGVPPTLQWFEVDLWRYASRDQVAGKLHNAFIVPHTLTTGPGIDFHHDVTFVARPKGGLLNAYTRSDSLPSSHTFVWGSLIQTIGKFDITFEARQRITNDIKSLIQGSSPAFYGAPFIVGNATGAGNIFADFAKDSRFQAQYSALTYEPSALLQDAPVPSPPCFASVANAFTVQWEAVTPAGTSVSCVMHNADDGTAITPVTSGPGPQLTFEPVAGASGYYPVFTLNSSADRKSTPILASWRMYRDAVYQTINDPEKQVVGDDPMFGLTHVNITGPTYGNPSTESMTCEIRDLNDYLGDPLRVRGEVPIRVVTEYAYEAGVDLDPTKTSWLFEGRTNPDSGAISRLTGVGAAGPNVWPQQWWDISITANAQWTKLHTAQMLERQILIQQGVPMKATDLVRAAFSWAGYPDAEIDVPDAPIRFWVPPGDDASALILNPGSLLADFITRTVRDYLGWYVMRDHNAGHAGPVDSRGMWRVLKPPQPPYTPLAYFLESPPDGDGVRLALHPGAYGAVADNGLVDHGFVGRGKWTQKVCSPEGNALLVVGTSDGGGAGPYQVRQWWINPQSYAFPGATAPSPANNPDYLGYFKQITVADAAIHGQASVDFMTRRIFDIACHARTKAKIENAPLLLVTDPSDPLQVRPRPLRTYDPISITVNGETNVWLVTNCDITYESDTIQLCDISVQLPINGSVQLQGQSWQGWG